MPNVAKAVDAEFAHFDYAYEGCEAQGDLQVGFDRSMRPFSCPEGCGATYIMWRNPLNRNRHELKCVVCPVYAPSGN